MGYGRGKEFARNPLRDKRGLTPSQQVFVDSILKVGKIEAAKLAYPMATEKSQKEIADHNLKTPEVIRNISKMADAQGIKREDCLETIKDGLKATRLFGKEAVEHPDHSTRLKAAEMGLKLHGELRDDKTILPIPVTKEQYQSLCLEFWNAKPSGPVKP